MNVILINFLHVTEKVGLHIYSSSASSMTLTIFLGWKWSEYFYYFFL